MNQDDSVCKASGTYMVGHDKDCGSYHLCTNGTSATIKCPNGKLFNLEINECEQAEKVFCDKRPNLMQTTLVPVTDPTEPVDLCKLFNLVGSFVYLIILFIWLIN